MKSLFLASSSGDSLSSNYPICILDTLKLCLIDMDWAVYSLNGASLSYSTNEIKVKSISDLYFVSIIKSGLSNSFKAKTVES